MSDQAQSVMAEVSQAGGNVLSGGNGAPGVAGEVLGVGGNTSAGVDAKVRDQASGLDGASALDASLGESGSAPANASTGAGNGPGEKPNAEEGKADGRKAAPQNETATPGEISISLPEGFREDTGMTDGFKKLCSEKGFSSAQAQSLVDWMDGMSRQHQDTARAALQTMWGNRAEENRRQAETAFNMLDRRVGGKLSASHAGWMLANSAEGIELLYAISELSGDESFGGFDAGGADDDGEDLTQFYKNLFHIKD